MAAKKVKIVTYKKEKHDRWEKKLKTRGHSETYISEYHPECGSCMIRDIADHVLTYFSFVINIKFICTSVFVKCI